MKEWERRLGKAATMHFCLVVQAGHYHRLRRCEFFGLMNDVVTTHHPEWELQVMRSISTPTRRSGIVGWPAILESTLKGRDALGI